MQGFAFRPAPRSEGLGAQTTPVIALIAVCMKVDKCTGRTVCLEHAYIYLWYSWTSILIDAHQQYNYAY